MTSNSQEQFKDLLNGFLNQSLSAEEIRLFFGLLREPENEALVAELLDRDLKEGTYSDLSSGDTKALIYRHLREKMSTGKTLTGRFSPSARTMAPWKRWWAVAAAVLLIASTISVLVLRKRPVTMGKLADLPAPTATNPHYDINPGSAKAILRLANGKIIVLDSAGKGTMAIQGGVQVVKPANGEVLYRPAGSGKVEYNTLTLPKGSRTMVLVLADGTKVTINAGSSITYPTAFPDSDRKVEMTGEAYFDVARRPGAPFIVTKGAVMVQVLGTQFNVNAYDDEPAINVTLLAGSVKVLKGGAGSMLRPGQQARISATSVRVLNAVDTNQVVAWKNGRFAFESTSVEEVMRQLARWYDVDIACPGLLKQQHFSGGISRYVPLSKVLEMLETTGIIRFTVSGNRITVLP